MSNKGKHIYYAKAKGIVGFYEKHFYTNYFAKNDEEAINIAESKLNECTGQIYVNLYDIIVENKEHNRINLNTVALVKILNTFNYNNLKLV